MLWHEVGPGATWAAIASHQGLQITDKAAPIEVRPHEGPSHEAYLPTLQDPPRPHPWFPGAHEDQGWPQGHRQPSCQGPQASGSVISRPGLVGAVRASDQYRCERGRAHARLCFDLTFVTHRAATQPEIGRASCRERV